MFSEVSQAILPMALRQRRHRGDLERAGLLIESLAKHWRDSAPFQLLIVSPADDVSLIRSTLPRFPNIEVSVRAESDFFPAYSPFYLYPGWYRQQVIKLRVPVLLNFGGFLTLDSDVCCVGDFDAATFVDQGKALSRWEPKRHHDWWQGVARTLGMSYDQSAHGLSVTPNIVHSELAAQALEHLRIGPIDPLWVLGAQMVRRLGHIVWTEYSLYTNVAELNGNLFDYHVHWDPCYFQDIQLFSEHASVWGAADFERVASEQSGANPRGKFIIVQSHARIPLHRVRDYCLSFAN